MERGRRERKELPNQFDVRKTDDPNPQHQGEKR